MICFFVLDSWFLFKCLLFVLFLVCLNCSCSWHVVLFSWCRCLFYIHGNCVGPKVVRPCGPSDTDNLPTSLRRCELLRLWDDGDSRQFLGHGDFNRGRAQSASQYISSTLCLFARLCMCIQLKQSFLALGVVVAVAASLSGLAGHPPTPTTRQFSPRRRVLLMSFICPA